MKVQFDLAKKRVDGELVRSNNKTLYVKFQEPEEKGGGNKVIKRHLDKHHVVFTKDEIEFVSVAKETV